MSRNWGTFNQAENSCLNGLKSRGTLHLLLSAPYFVGGIKKVTFQVMCGVLSLVAINIF
ncbi:hypothetical protein TRIP_E70015 [uncultured Spirochaetota bacterium]|nr:hypothetical protein TRIP_E70015 [uncultured Spirochaetota bacterium]